MTMPKGVKAGQLWHVKMGAESRDMSRQAMAFLPTEMWIYAGDSVEWTSGTHANHTVTFLKPVRYRVRAMLRAVARRWFRRR